MMLIDTLKYIVKNVCNSVVNWPGAADAVKAGRGPRGRVPRSFYIVSALFLLLFSLSVNSFAASYTVPGDYASISAAITASSSGDTITVSMDPGTSCFNRETTNKKIKSQCNHGTPSFVKKG